MEKTYYVYLKTNLEKTGDYIKSDSRLFAAKYFAAKKNISLKDWLNIYTTYNDKNLNDILKSNTHLEYKNSKFEYKFNKEKNMFELINIEDPLLNDICHKKLTIKNFIDWKNYLLNAGYQLIFK